MCRGGGSESLFVIRAAALPCGRPAPARLSASIAFRLCAPTHISRLTFAQATGNNQNAVKLRAKAIVQNFSVRTDKGSVDYIDGFLDQIKRGSK
jgi:hypothetical protein